MEVAITHLVHKPQAESKTYEVYFFLVHKIHIITC